MPHKAERCFRCKERYDTHGRGKAPNGKLCKEFEFVPVSTRNPRDIEFSTMFQSESSRKKYEVIYWKQGDYSCNCTGWRNYRNCKHIEQVAANPKHYQEQDATVNSTSGSIVGTIDVLKAKMAAAEAAAKRGDTVELQKLEAEIETQSQIMGAAADTLMEAFHRTSANIKAHVFGVEPKVAQPAPTQAHKPVQVVNPDDPFGD